MSTTDHGRKWRPAPAPVAPGPHEVSVWRVELDLPQTAADALAHLLSDNEMARARRFKRPEHGRRFTVARAALRTVLGGCTATTPEAVRLEYGDHGKPRLAGPLASPRLHFNLSHSGPLALIATTAGRRVGVDVEQIRHDIRAERIARRFFSEEEAQDLEALAPPQRAARFFALWTRKEAYVKALGRGLFMPLDGFQVAAVEQLPADPIPIETGTADQGPWRLVDLDAGPGYAAALVAEGEGWSPQLWQLQL